MENKKIWLWIGVVLILTLFGELIYFIYDNNKQASGTGINFYDKDKKLMPLSDLNTTEFIKVKTTVNNIGNNFLKCWVSSAEPNILNEKIDKGIKTIPNIILTKRYWESDFIHLSNLYNGSKLINLSVEISCDSKGEIVSKTARMNLEMTP